MSSLTCEASRLIRQVSPPEEGKNVKTRIGEAAQLLRWKLSRARDIWHAGQKVRVRPEEIDTLRRMTDPPATVAVRDAVAALQAEREAARADLQELRRERARLATLLDRIERIDPDFAGPLADATRHQVQQVDRAKRALDRPGNRG